MKFGSRLKEILEEKNISQIDFSKGAELNSGLVSRVLNGEKPSSQFIYKTVEYLPEVDMNYLLKEDVQGVLNESHSTYEKTLDPMDLIVDIENKIKNLKRVLTQK
ncbi:helix-turn-helix domain-containing protein [Sediminibacter sp. Hel_I_10]|uniref:helix-turn-helix domain-containing protein n=1 Tax=Sediminibacter sp. Hel_I_10 TaxID=1392490 RepID=UPI000478883D|nr:helix-turn-helix transcriptional regulator [Sediminibacter sp. Hel_I_10]